MKISVSFYVRQILFLVYYVQFTYFFYFYKQTVSNHKDISKMS